MKKLFYTFFFLLPVVANAQLIKRITTIAGTGAAGYSGDNGAATAANIYDPYNIAVDKYNNIYFSDYYNHRIRKITPAGIITTIAGTGVAGCTGDGGPATAAQINFPEGVAVDTSGNVYYADWAHERVRKIDNAGIITTFAGNGTPAYTGDNGPATAATLWRPLALATDKHGNLYIAEQYNYCVRKVNAAGIITTIAGGNGSGFSGDGGPATAATFNFPVSVAVDNSGNVYIGENNNSRVRKVNTSGMISTYAGTGVLSMTGDGGPASSAAMYFPQGLATDNYGNLYIADVLNNRIRVVNSAGTINTIVSYSGSAGYGGDGGPASAALVNNPHGVAVDTMGNLLIADYANDRIRRVMLYCTPHAGTISGRNSVCPCYPIQLSESLGGGAWVMGNANASISATGKVAYNSVGADTAYYVVTDTCGTATAAFPFTVSTVGACDSFKIVHGKRYICLDSTAQYIDSIGGGIWAMFNSNASISPSGLVTGLVTGSDTVKYTLIDSCGNTTILIKPVIIMTKHCDSANIINNIPLPVGSVINLFPNPATNVLTIQADQNTFGSFVVSNNVGTIVLQQNITDMQTFLNVNYLPSGMYYIRFIGESAIEVRKFVKE